MKKGQPDMQALDCWRMYRRLLLAATLSACANPAANPDYIPQGSLTATVLDQAGAPVAGADLRVLSRTDSFQWAHGVSRTDGSVVFDAQTNPIAPTTSVGLLGADYRAQLSPPSGYAVPSTQSNPMPFQVMDKQTTSLTFRIAKLP